jgi:SAM-dependent methyltransferase
MQSFDDIADYYEVLTNAAARLEREGPLLREQLAQAPGKRVLDLACGTGLHALFFTELGAEVTAIDASEAMVRHAQSQRPHARIEYRAQDMRAISGGPWDLVVCLGNSLALLQLDADLHRVFSLLGAALTPHGRFLAQLVNTTALSAQAPRHRVERKEIDEGHLVAIKSLAPQGDHTLLTLAFFAGSLGRYHSATETAILRHWTREDLRAAGHGAGLVELEAFGDFTGTAFDTAQSGDLLTIFQKSAD